mgnify:CR=1 FL=1
MTTNLTNSTNKVPNVPPLRFPEFTGEWEKSTLGGIADIVGGGTPETDRKEYWNGEIIWYTPSEIGKNKYSSDSERHITQEGLDNSSAKLLPSGTILLSTRATIGESSIALNKCTTNQGFQSLIAQRGIYHEFLYYLIATKKHELVKRACGSTFLEISANEVRKVPVLVPLFKEQYKLSTFLGLIDQRIETQNKIIQHLESLIKGISKMLLTKQGNTFIKDCLVCNSSTLQESSVLPCGKYPVYGATGISGYLDVPQVEHDAILIIKDGAGVGNVRYATDKYGVIGTLNYLSAKNGYNLKYLYYCLRIFNFTPFVTGLAIPHIYFRDYGTAKIYCPSLIEQKHIANNLSNIERKIEVEKQLLEELKEQKKYLLSQMFI